MVSIVGSSGSEKSTLLNLIATLDRPSSGLIQIGRQEIGSLGGADLIRVRRDKIGFIFQFFNLLPSLSCLKNVGLPLHMRGWLGPNVKDRARMYNSKRRQPNKKALVNESRWSRLTRSVLLWCLLPVTLALALAACGGGGAGSVAPSPDFTLSITPGSISMQSGGSVSASLSATGSNGFSSQISVQVSGVPTGVKVSPSAIIVTPGTPQQLTFSADASTPASNATVTFTGTSGSLSHSVQEALAIIEPIPDFTLSVTPTSVTVQSGSSATVSVSATPSNGFSSQVNVQVGSLPTGVSVSPSGITLTPGIPQRLIFSANSSATPSKATLTFTGTSGSLTHSAKEGLTIISKIASNIPPFRMRYVRTDATTAYFGWVNSHWIVYNPPTSRFFVTDPDSSRVFALDARTEQLVGTIMVPGAYGIDDTPDHSTLYVGTQIGDVYKIDPVSMTVTRRFLSAGIGPSGFSAYSALVMADGRLALLGGQGGIPSVDGYSEFAIWNPVDNSISLYGGGVCGILNMGVFTRTPDRTKLVVASIDEPAELCEFDAATGTGNFVIPGMAFIWHVAISPDGKWIIIPQSGQAVVFDAHTLAQVAQFNVAGDTSSSGGFAVSADSKTLYAPSDTIVYAYDAVDTAP